MVAGLVRLRTPGKGHPANTSPGTGDGIEYTPCAIEK